MTFFDQGFVVARQQDAATERLVLKERGFKSRARNPLKLEFTWTAA
jgi:hypothetical protein